MGHAQPKAPRRLGGGRKLIANPIHPGRATAVWRPRAGDGRHAGNQSARARPSWIEQAAQILRARNTPVERTEGLAGTRLSSAPGGQRSLSARGRAGKPTQISTHSASPIRPAHPSSLKHASCAALAVRCSRWTALWSRMHPASCTDMQIGAQRPGEGGLPCLVGGPARSGWIRRPTRATARPCIREAVGGRAATISPALRKRRRGLGENGRTGRGAEPGRNRRREETRRTRPRAQAPYSGMFERGFCPGEGPLSPCAHARRGLSGRSSVDIGRIPRRGSSRTDAVARHRWRHLSIMCCPCLESQYTECLGRGTENTEDIRLP